MNATFLLRDDQKEDTIKKLEEVVTTIVRAKDRDELKRRL